MSTNVRYTRRPSRITATTTAAANSAAIADSAATADITATADATRTAVAAPPAGTASAAVVPHTVRAIRALVRTDDDTSTTVLRLTLAAVMFPHGAQKLLGWFGGYGFEGTMGYLTQGMGLPWVVAALVIAIEFFGPIALALGFLSRVAAAGVAAVMVGAVLTSHVQHGFFMNWSGAQAGEGFEFHLLVLAITAALMIRGSGDLSLDRRISRIT
jgi:putative oxidoreductase